MKMVFILDLRSELGTNTCNKQIFDKNLEANTTNCQTMRYTKVFTIKNPKSLTHLQLTDKLLQFNSISMLNSSIQTRYNRYNNSINANEIKT
jgi:hypothetical protein